MLTLLPLLGLVPFAVAGPTSGSFNVLTYNVAGLPAILNNNGVTGDKTTNTALIGQKFAQSGIDVIHVQEDFNYHDTLYANDNHPFRTETSGGVPFGSGLNTLANFGWVDFDRVKWDKCSTIEAADCFTPKGFTFMRMKVEEGVWIDFYNIHADAGDSSADKKARASNLHQVSDYITQNSFGNAVLIFGDSNSRYLRQGDIPGLFRTEQNMTDVWVHLIRNDVEPTTDNECGNPAANLQCETLDKVWFRGSPIVDLQATQFQYAANMFLQPDGSILSDHNPVLVDFSWSLRSSYKQSDFHGGPHGTFFNDLTALHGMSGAAVQSLTIRAGSRIDAVSLTLTNGQTFTHGGTGGTASSLTLAAGETLASVELCQGKKNDHTRIFFMSVTTSASQTLSAGVRTEECVTRTAESGMGIVGFVGRSGDEVDRLGFIFGPN